MRDRAVRYSPRSGRVYATAEAGAAVTPLVVGQIMPPCAAYDGLGDTPSKCWYWPLTVS